MITDIIGGAVGGVIVAVAMIAMAMLLERRRGGSDVNPRS